MSEISPPRRLPWDVLLLLFKQADPSTLAVLGRVSYDFLASTTLGLYRDVEVTSVEQLEALFCERKVGRKTKNSGKHIRINPHLSLSQIQTLCLDLTSLTLTSLPASLNISSSRIDDATVIPLRHLQMSFEHETRHVVCLLYSSLLPLLDPSRCSYKDVGSQTAGLRWLNLTFPSFETTSLAGWTRLEELDLSNILPFSSGPSLVSYLAGLPTPTLDRRRVVRLRLFDFDGALRDFDAFRAVLGLYYMQSGSVVFLVETEEEREQVATAIRTSPELARWGDVFAVEVVI